MPAQKLLSCVIRTGERYGTAYVVDILLGSRQKRIIDNGHNKISTWGIGKDIAKDDWFELVRVLVESGYLVKEAEYGVLSLTSLAREVLQARDTIMLPFGTAPSGMLKAENARHGGERETSLTVETGTLKFPKKGGSKIDGADVNGTRILSRLKNLRRGLAEAASVPPYVIFSDRTLEDIAVKKPASHRDLLDIYGIGDVKAERYGEFILKAVSGEGNLQNP